MVDSTTHYCLCCSDPFVGEMKLRKDIVMSLLNDLV